MSEKPWGGRFESPTDEFVEACNASIDVDARMYAEDIAGSRAHAKMLSKQGIISQQDCNAILSGLDEILGEINSGEFEFPIALEGVLVSLEARADRENRRCRQTPAHSPLQK